MGTTVDIDIVKVGDNVTFYTCCNSDRELFYGTVSFDEGLGLVCIIDNKKYQVIKMVDLELNNKKKCVCLNWHRAIQPNKGKKAICSNCYLPRK